MVRRPRSSVRGLALAAVLGPCVWLQAQGSAPRRTSATAWFLDAETAIAHGKRADAGRMASGRGAADPLAAVVLAQLDEAHGKYQDAQTRLEPVAARATTSEAALELALLYRTTGKNAEADRLLSGILDAGEGASDPEVVFRAGRAAHALDRAQDAKTLDLAAERAGESPILVETELGNLFFEKYNPPEALKSFNTVLSADAQWAPAQAGLARVLADDDPDKSAAAAAKAIATDPELADPHLLLASLDLDQDHGADATAELNKVLAVNPSDIDAHTMLAAAAYVKDNTAAYDSEIARVLQVNPHDGDVYRVVGDLAADHYRFEDAAALARKALALDPDDTKAESDLGMLLMRTGDETAARQALERAFKADPYNVLTFNLLGVLDTLDKFVTVKNGEFVFRMDPSESAVLGEYAIPLAKDAIQKMSAQFGFTPTGPILVEIFPKHDDFAVRNVGLEGMIGALGACFGRVVTMDSPAARNRPGSFAWEATLWHELTHVVTLQMSNQRIPRWLTEGISVYEEQRARPDWDRDMEVTYARAIDTGKVLKLADLNAGFTKPETISLAYYEASLVVDHIVTRFGQDGLNRLVRSFADDLETPAAIQRTLGVPMADLQASFDQAMDQRFGAMARALRDANRPVDASSLDALKTAAAAHPDSYIAQLALGEQLAAARDASAYAALERASALVPNALGAESPHAIMAQLAEQLGDRARAMKEYEAWLDADHTNIDAARKLAALAQTAGNEQVRGMALDRIVSLDPFDASAHTEWGRLALKSGNAVLAAREFRAALDTGAPDKAAAHCDLAESYLQGGRPAEAKKEVLAAIEIAPAYERAQDLLLKISGKTE